MFNSYVSLLQGRSDLFNQNLGIFKKQMGDVPRRKWENADFTEKNMFCFTQHGEFAQQNAVVIHRQNFVVILSSKNMVGLFP